jgi:hypothetical protein
MPQMRLNPTPQTLQDAACYQFALSGSEDQETLTSINERFSAIGNYLLTGDSDHLVHFDVINQHDLDTISAIHDAGQRRLAAMNILCREFGLVSRAVDGAPFLLGGRFKDDDQMLPEHMWVCDRQFSYDTMPENAVFRDDDADGMRPPLETDIPVAEITLVGLTELTPFQQIITAAHFI